MSRSSVHLRVIDQEADASRQTHALALRERIRGEVRFGAHDRMLYATDASLYQVEPIGVVIPIDVDDIMHAIQYAREQGLAVLPRGAGTSLAGQTVNHAIIIDCSVHCRNVISIDETQRECVVEPGVVLDELNEHLRAKTNGRLWFGPDVATSRHANIGGMIGNNSAGTHSILYGRTVEHVKGMDVVLADGTSLALSEGAAVDDPRVAAYTRQVAEIILPLAATIRERFPKTRRRVNGYNLDLILDQLDVSTEGTYDKVNLASLMCGSEGTLATTTQATLNLVPRPSHVGLAVIAFSDLNDAIDAVFPLLATGPSAVELIDELIMELAALNREYRQYLDLLPRTNSGDAAHAVLYVEYFADDATGLHDRFEALRALMSDHAIACHTDATAILNAWKLRKAGEPLLHALPGTRKPITFVEDTAVDPSRLASFVKDFQALVSRHGTRASFYAHASVGCLHIRPILDVRAPADRAAMESIATEVTDLVRSYGGALSGEHGDGRARSALLERFYGAEIVDAFRAIKHVFDPENRMNPGNIVKPQQLLENLRVDAGAHTEALQHVEPFYDYTFEEGIQHAFELCNGAGVCRKKQGGTMCPSYMATLDERHSTRGRGNALRLAISGQIGSSDDERPVWNDPETLRTLDLCLSCKACKSECPSNVDVARYKSEYLAQSYRESRRVPLSVKAFAHVRALNRLGSSMPALSNAMANLAPLRWIANRMLGIDPRRSLPRFQRNLWKQRHPGRVSDDAPAVVLYPDCFTMYNEPEIGLAAITVLEGCGYRVIVPKDVGCCGRSMLSTGMVSEAKQTITRSARALSNAVRASGATAVVACEPSCLSAIKDDWQVVRGVDVAPELLVELHDLAFLPEHWVEHAWAEHPRRPEFDTPSAPARVALHGHCHQKALWGTETSADALRRVAGERLDVLDTGCCGMAGSFGMTSTRYDISQQIGELGVLPAVRTMDDASVCVAPGTSCRHQIRDATGVRAIHPIEYLAQHIAQGESH